MERGSLQNSESVKSLGQDFHQTQVLGQYLSNRFDWFATTVIDYMEEKDPQKRFGKMTAARLKETEDLRKSNKDLLQKVARLEKKISDLQSEIHKIKSPQPFNHQNGQTGSPNSMKNENSSNPTARLGDNALGPSLEILPEEQKEALQRIEQMNEQMKEQRKQEQNQLIVLSRQFESICETLTRIAKIEKVRERDLYNEKTLTVEISKQKYDLLIDFYCQGTSYLSVQGDPDKDQVGQFRAQQLKAPNQMDQQASVWLIEELQKMFEALAQNNGKGKQWKRFLSSRQSQTQKQFIELKEIASKQTMPQEDLAKLQQCKEYLKVNESLEQNNSNLDTTVSVMNYLDKELEKNLFQKIKQLMKRLNFSQVQFDLFVLFDKKRECSKLYDVDDFLRKFKNKTDLYEISEAYALYLIRTLNFMLINVMEELSESNPQNLEWFREKLSKNSKAQVQRIFKRIEEQFSAYMEEKHNKQGQTKEKRKFDKEGKLEKELVQTVYRYRDLFKSSIFNKKSQINIKI